MASRKTTSEAPVASLIFVKRQSSNPKLVVDAEIVFGQGAGFLAGMKITGIAIWQTDKGLRVTMPAKKTAKRYYDMLLPAKGGQGIRQAFTDHVLKEWQATESAQAVA